MTCPVRMSTICPYCGEEHEYASGLMGAGIPHDGDATVCAVCGCFAIFDDDAPGGLRIPTRKEARQITTDPRCMAIMNAWLAVTSKRH